MSKTERRIKVSRFSEGEIYEIINNSENYDESVLGELFSYLRWGNYVKSPYLNSYNVKKRTRARDSRPYYYCVEAHSEFNCRTNTIFHQSKMGLAKTIRVILYMYDNGVHISQTKLQNDLNISDSTAWRLLYKFRAMECEADKGYRDNIISYIRSCLRVNPLLVKEDGVLKFVPIRYVRSENNPYANRKTREEIEQENQLSTSKDVKKLNFWQKFKISFKLFCGLLKS